MQLLRKIRSVMDSPPLKHERSPTAEISGSSHMTK
jgi:hypothetical protein